MIPVEWVEQARQRIGPYVKLTPVTQDTQLGLTFKWENRQVTGSFKARGATNKLLSLLDWERQQGVVACSTGNHGQGVAYACQVSGSTCTIFVPQDSPPAKLRAMRARGAEVRNVAGGYEEAERAAIEFAQEYRKVFVSPYNDGQVIAGQATVMHEILEQTGGLEAFDAILVPVGGAGLISGIGCLLEGRKDHPKLIGVQPEASPYAHQFMLTGTQSGVHERSTIAEGLAGAIDEQSITLPMLKRYADDIVLVTEDEIRAAIAHAWYKYGQYLEGSAAVSLAARLTGKIQAQSALCILTGGNIEPELFDDITREFKHG